MFNIVIKLTLNPIFIISNFSILLVRLPRTQFLHFPCHFLYQKMKMIEVIIIMEEKELSLK
jgi:hypothetical protein